jgi:periodic tryptophan protein 2
MFDFSVYIFKTPGQITGEYNSFVTKRIYAGALDDTTWIDWSDDSKTIALGSKDNTVRLYTIDPYVNFRPYVLSGHSEVIVSCFFERNSLDLNTLSRR